MATAMEVTVTTADLATDTTAMGTMAMVATAAMAAVVVAVEMAAAATTADTAMATQAMDTGTATVEEEEEAFVVDSDRAFYENKTEQNKRKLIRATKTKL